MNAPVTRIRSERLLSSCLPAFETRYLGSEPFVLSRMIATPEFCFGWSHFEVLLASVAPEALLFAGASETPGRADSKEAGAGVVISGAERFCPVLRSFARSVQEQLGSGYVQISASAHVRRRVEQSGTGSPASRAFEEAERALLEAPPESGTRPRAFEMCSGRSREDAWRTSEGPAFFVQSQGVRKHYFRPNTVVTDRGLPDNDPDAHGFETSRLWMAQLSEGDVLYLPRGWWHRHEASADSLSLVMTAQREQAAYGMIVA